MSVLYVKVVSFNENQTENTRQRFDITHMLG